MVMGSLAVSDRALATRSSKAGAVEVGAAPPQPVWLNACIRYRVSCLCVFEGVPGLPAPKEQLAAWILDRLVRNDRRQCGWRRSPGEGQMSKRLVLCCDGTWNMPDQESGGRLCPTNVTKLALGVADTADDGKEQRVFYHRGVGTGRWERLLGGATGFG